MSPTLTPESASVAELLACLPDSEQTQLLARLKRADVEAIEYDWSFWARPKQVPPPGDWRVWLVLAGRGFGKTRTGAEWVRAQVAAGRRRIALVAPTAADARDVMIEGESGIMAVCPSWDRPLYEPSKRRVTWPNGAIATAYSADEPDRLRGPQHDGAWADELAAWRYAEAWDQLLFGLRLGTDPRAVVTTTPKPVNVIRELVTAPTTAITRGSTYENRGNLASAFLEQIVAKYEGTRLGRQELNAELLDDVPGALWQRSQIDALRVRSCPDLVRVVVAVDPATTSGEKADQTGIVVVGVATNGHAYVVADRTCRLSPDGWAREAVAAYDEYRADRLVAEVNNGGELVEATIRTVSRRISYKAVHASRGKRVRAEPVAALYEQGKIHHVGALTDLEDQMCAFVPDVTSESPDRVDALVWALTELMLGPAATPFVLAQGAARGW